MSSLVTGQLRPPTLNFFGLHTVSIQAAVSTRTVSRPRQRSESGAARARTSTGRVVLGGVPPCLGAPG
jgi:uncharacterized membrane protein